MNTTDEFLEDGVTPNPHYIKPQEKQETEEERIDRLVEEKAAEKLKDVKTKLDNAYKARDEALARAAELDLKEKNALKEKLEAEGKFKELAEMRVQEEKDRAAQIQAERDALAKQNLELTRDNMLRGALQALPFRNDRASEVAYKQIASELIQIDGKWVHSSGVPIKDYVTAFSSDADNSFLFKAKGNGGAGSGGAQTNAPSKDGSLFKMSQKDVLEGIANGTIKHR